MRGTGAPRSLYARRMERVGPSAIMELLKTTAGGDYISFASGLPDPTLYPADLIRGIADLVLTADGRAALQYGPAEGHPPLREYVAEMLRTRGLTDATPEHILITNGSQQALDLTARALLDPGDGVLIESPSYLAAIQAFDSYDAHYHAVPMTETGADLDQAAEALAGGGIKLAFTLPTFQNPMGVTTDLETRQRLAELAAEHRVAVLEDDAYHDLRYEGDPLPPVTALAQNPWAIYTGTFSKTIAPGLRVGYLYAQPEVVTRLSQLKQITDLHTGSFTQRIALEFCRQGHLQPAVTRLRDTYRSRLAVMQTALEEHAGGWMRWTRPQGGMFIFAWLPEGMDAMALLPRVMDAGVVYVPGKSFFPVDTGANTLRLNFVSADENAITAGIATLCRVLREAAP